MKPSREKLEAIFEAALALESDEQRAAYLNEACPDPELRREVESLLEAHRNPDSVLADPAPGQPDPGRTAPSPLNSAEKPGDRIGRYKLLQQIGEGGCGIVYMAEQEEPVRRRVALKVIKLGMDTRSVIARFEAERQALAMMDHPNIAKVLDAGATETGRPYFVMELVRGIKITEFCDQNGLSTRERLMLFIQISQAIQHAHQKGIIHRDIKPSNILVTLHDAVPVPKVIDFGIAKATNDQPLTNKTLFTAFEQFIGTPAYMSPEQAAFSSLDIDTRSDIYSLGVLLYELLTGRTPFDAKELLELGLDAIRKTIREKEPLKPSTKLQTLQGQELTATARCRGTEMPTLISLLRGDLDWIVMKCLEKDRARRYETANGLAMDVKRHLDNEPVLARPPSRLYEFQKTVRRHRVGFVAIGAVLAALTIGVVVSSLEALHARRAETSAQQFLYQSLVGQARATRLARRVGYRDQVFALLAQAKALNVPQKNLADLRQEAVACLGDFVGLTPATFTNFPGKIVSGRLDRSGNHGLFRLAERTFQLRQMPSGTELARFTVTNRIIQDFGFDSTGDQLFALCAEPWQVYIWSSETNGPWRETDNRRLPDGTIKLMNSPGGVLAINVATVTPAAHMEEWEYPGLGLAVKFAQPPPEDSENLFVRIRALDLHTGAFVPGYNMTNALCRDCVLSLGTSGDGQVLEVKTWDSRNPYHSTLVNLYDWKSRKLINQLPPTSNATLSLRDDLSDDGNYLVNLSDIGGIIYTVAGLEPITQLKGDFFGASALIVRHRLAVSAANQNLIRLRDLKANEDVALLDEPDAGVPAAFTADGSSLLSVGPNHARLYQLNTADKVDLPLRTAAVTGVAFSPDGLRLASVGRDGTIRVCDSITGQTLWETNDPPGAGPYVGYSPDGRWLAMGDRDTDRVWIRDAQTGRRLLEIGTNRAGGTFSAQLSPNGRYLATSGLATEGIKIRTVKGGNSAQPHAKLEANLLREWGPGLGLAFAPDSRSVAFVKVSAAGDELSGDELYLWDFERAAQPHPLRSHILRTSEGVDFTPDGSQLIVMNDRGEVEILDVATGNRVSSFYCRGPAVGVELRLSPDGSKLALTASTPSGIGLGVWEPRGGKLLYSLPPQAGSVLWLAWSPDSRRLAVARDNGNVAIWNLEAVNKILAQLGLNP